MIGFRHNPDELREEFLTAPPFPHIVIDDFADPGLLSAVVDVIPDEDYPKWHQYRDGKRGIQKLAILPGPINRLAAELASDAFCVWLSRLSGVEGIRADPRFTGGGIHCTERGGRLGIHTDFNSIKRLGSRSGGPFYRRLNCFLFLNREWRDGWRGHLELCDREKNAVKRIAPVFNRFVAFESNAESWHGHPSPLNCPAGVCRLSIASYYYTAERPAWFTGRESTIYA